MDYLWSNRSRRFSTEKGMEIDRPNMKSLDNSKDRQQRSAQTDEASENQSHVQNHSAEDMSISDIDEEYRPL
ncbi:hypothetical protein PoB_007412700 [Plakobranchus ocellatus]|uniref:Uncharacterized protein n=1 Tax=Plakobranchus ocellatus TaxID=259542 RepID=A0AAV4DTD4_9GAST|nr:hypothetical protein PoB_007412700 [Plakobranchus ocellatus]